MLARVPKSCCLLFARPRVHSGIIECVLLLHRMCSLTIECVHLLRDRVSILVFLIVRIEEGRVCECAAELSKSLRAGTSVAPNRAPSQGF